MNYLKYLLIGIFFGITMTKSEAISWYRIQEMFRFHSFHMYGIIITAVIVSAIIVALIKKANLKNTEGKAITFKDKDMSVTRYLVGGSIFGVGWALSGACPGPMYTLLGNGFTVIIIMIASATLGTFVYGILREKLPH